MSKTGSDTIEQISRYPIVLFSILEHSYLANVSLNESLSVKDSALLPALP